jgi:capsular exopolysaccharide synthesis family protein
MKDQGLDLREYLNVALKRWWLLILGPLLAGTMILTMSVLNTDTPASPPIYEATTTLLIEGKRGINSYEELAMTRAVLDQAIAVGDLPLTVATLRSMTLAVLDEKTQFFRITVISSDPALAALAADGVADSLIQQVDRQRGSQLASVQQELARQADFLRELNSPEAVQEITRSLTSNVNSRLAIIDRAESSQLAVTPASANTARNLALAIFLGGVISLGLTLAVEYLQNPLRSPGQVARRFNLNHLGSVPRWSGARRKTALLVQREGQDPYLSEAINMTATRLEFVAGSRQARTLLVASPDAGEGRSTLAANLAVALASGWQEVVLIDADLRRPALHQFFNLDNRRGLSTLLSEAGAPIMAELQSTDFPRLRVLTAGPTSPNPLELLKSPQMARVFQELKESGVLALVDVPPLAVASDGLIVASLVEGIVLVADAQRGRVGALESALEYLQSVATPILGFVWNRVPNRPFGPKSRERSYHQDSHAPGSGPRPSGSGGSPAQGTFVEPSSPAGGRAEIPSEAHPPVRLGQN